MENLIFKDTSTIFKCYKLQILTLVTLYIFRMMFKQNYQVFEKAKVELNILTLYIRKNLVLITIYITLK